MSQLPVFIDQQFENNSYTEKGWVKGEYDQCTFKNCNFQNVYLSNTSFMECTFVDCQMSNCKVGNVTFNDVTFKNCKLLGVQFFECNPFMASFHFENCNLELASFEGMEIPSTLFKKCHLNSADFTNTTLKSSSINNCNLIYSKFLNSNLEKVDFTQSYNFEIDPENNNLKGARFSMEHLHGLLAKYGVIIE